MGKRIVGSSVARMAGNILGGMFANPAVNAFKITTSEANLLRGYAFSLAIGIAEEAERLDAAKEEEVRCVIMRKPVVMEDEGRHFAISFVNSRAAAEAWIAAQKGQYFGPGDYYVIEDPKKEVRLG